MRLRPTQFGVRETTASSRQHAPRLAADTRSNIAHLAKESPETQSTSSRNARLVKGAENLLHAASQDTATGGDARDECHLLNVHEVAELLWEILALPQGRSIGVGRVPLQRIACHLTCGLH